jgi:hypothetical protein
VVGDLTLGAAAAAAGGAPLQLGAPVGLCIGDPPIGVTFGLPFIGEVGFEVAPTQPPAGARPDKFPVD